MNDPSGQYSPACDDIPAQVAQHCLRFLIAPADINRLKRTNVLRDRRIGRGQSRAETIALDADGAVLPPPPEGVVLPPPAEGAAVAPAPHAVSLDIKHNLWRLSLDPIGIAELATRDATFAAGNLRQRQCLLELTLLSGNWPGLFDVARELAAALPIQPVPDDLPSRALAFAGGIAPRAVRAGSVPLRPEQSGVSALAAILDGCRVQILANEPAVAEARLADGIHQMRVALRRLRAALSLFSKLLPSDLVTGLRLESAWAAGALGPARDLDVFLDETLTPLIARLPGEPGLEILAANGRALRVQHAAAAVAAVRSPRFVRLTIDLAALVAGLEAAEHDPGAAWVEGLRAPIGALAPGLLDWRWRAVRKRGRAFADQVPDARHEVRIQGKKLRYAIDFFWDLYPGKKTRRFARALAALQEVLGFGQDLAVQQGVLDQLLAGGGAAIDLARAGGLIEGWRLGRVEHVERESRALWAAVRKTDLFWRPCV